LVQPSRLFDLWRRLYTRFQIEPFPADPEQGPGVATTIFPVTIADDLVKLPVAQSATLDIQASAGGFVLAFTVPEGKRWQILWAFRSSTTANTRIRGIFTPSDVTLFLTVVGTSNEVPRELQGFVMEQDDRIGLETTGNAADSAVTIQLYVLEEDAF